MTHIKAVRVRPQPTLASSKPLKTRTSGETVDHKSQKGKSSPLIALIWALTLLWFGVVKPCAEEDSVLTQASSLFGPPLHGSEGL